LRLVFVGASLLANGAGKGASPKANIRWQASSQCTSQAFDFCNHAQLLISGVHCERSMSFIGS
jgi:hypothetical protein